MLTRLKGGSKPARIVGIRPEIIFAIQIANGVWSCLEMSELVITSVTDGKHSRGSKHYTGYAVDLRSRDFGEEGLAKAIALLKKCLGADFDVVLESDHIHIEFDPKTPIN